MAPALTGGSMKTVEFARKHGKPWLHLHFEEGKAVDKLRSFVSDNGIEILNVAGPRASKEPKVGEFVIQTLDLTFGAKKSPAAEDELKLLMEKAERDLARWEQSETEQL